MPEIDFDALKSVPVRPLPAEEVRRLGDRRRARRRALVAGGTTLAAVAAAAVLGVTLGGGSSDHTVQPISPSSSVPDRSEATTPTTAVTAPSSGSAVSDDGSAGAGAWSPDLLPTASDLVEGGETATPWQAGPIHDGVPADWLRPCRGDAAEAPVQPGYVAAAWRDLTPLRDTMGADAQGQATLLDYPTQSAAQAAYQDLANAYAGCAAVIRADGRKGVSKVTRTDVDLGAFGSGPNAAEASTFMLTYPITDAVTQLQHGIAVDGSHLLVLTITQDTQDYWPDLQDSMPAVVERFGHTAGLPRTLGADHPSQVDYVRLGETYEQAMAGGDLVKVQDSGVTTWAMRPYAAVEHDNGSTTVVGSVCVTPRYGVEAIWMPPEVTTAEGIGIGSSEAQLRAAYPGLKDAGDGYLDHELWGGPDAADYHFGIQDGKVFEWALTSPRQHCFQ